MGVATVPSLLYTATTGALVYRWRQLFIWRVIEQSKVENRAGTPCAHAQVGLDSPRIVFCASVASDDDPPHLLAFGCLQQ